MLYQLSYGPLGPHVLSESPGLRDIQEKGNRKRPEASPGRFGMLPFSRKENRKEVIQPHLPVRLPCYDLAPLTSRTLDGVPPCGLDYRLRVQPTQVA